MALIHGDGPAVEAVARAVSGMQGAPQTEVWVAPAAAPQSAEAAMEALFHAPVRLVEAFANASPEPARDTTGEPAALRHFLLIVERRLLASGSGWPAHRAAVAALVAWMEDAALMLAPRCRINMLAMPLMTPSDLAPSLAWVQGRPIVTGQIIKLGPPPPSTAPFRGDVGEKP